ncbi:50S ribosomal protein L32 [Candidatus Uhrbacteria bacterium]|nr:50S ribosomal protein L32 [Candidatus Uhrbacteria bacterium]
MPVPARKKSRSAVRRRRSHDHLNAGNIGVCQTCQAPLAPHKACKTCGTYKGKVVLDVTRQAQRLAKNAQPVAHDHNDHEGHDHAKEESPSAKPPAKSKKKKTS